MKVQKAKGMDAYIRFRMPTSLMSDYASACEQTAHKKSEILRRLIRAWIDAGAPSPPFAIVPEEVEKAI